MPHGLPHWTALVSSHHSSQFLPDRKQGRSHNIFYDVASEVTYHHCCHILLIAQINPKTVWKETTQEDKYQEARIVRAVLEAGCHTY